MNCHRKRLAGWIASAAVVLCCAFPSGARADDDIDIICPCTVEFSNLTSVSFSFGIRNLQPESATGSLSVRLSARKSGDGMRRFFNTVATIDLPSVSANSTRAVQKYTAAFNRRREQGPYELKLDLFSEGGGRIVESVTWLADAVEFPAGGTAYSSVYFDGTPTIDLGDDSATVKLPAMKNGPGGTQADGLKLHLGTHSELLDYPSRIAEHDLGKDLIPGNSTGAATINMSFEADRLLDYVSLIVVNSDNRRILQEVVSVPDGEELPTREFTTKNASMLVDSDGDGVGDVNERMEGTDPDDSESTPAETTIDVLGMYVPSVVELYGGDPTTRLGHVVNLASIIFKDSGTGVKLRLVGMLAVEEEDFDDIEFVDKMAREYGADMGLLFWKSRGSVCGWAPVGGFNTNGAISFFGVPLANVVAPCGAGITAHEIGHVMGLGHSVIQRNNAPTGTYRWARGHGVFQKFGTTMTYEYLYGGAPVLDLFSDPDRDCKGLPCGSATDQKDAADAVAALNATRFQVARIAEAKPDTDSDGVVDPVDAFPNDPDEHSDFDSDGIGDKADTDDDGDGIADADDLFPLDSLDWADADSDGVGDNTDAFPDDPGETYDTDDDGVGDNTDLFPEDPLESVDTDNDGVGNNADAFPYDTREWLDTDGDGMGDNADGDADNDGVADTHDVYPLDATRSDATSYRIQLKDGANERLSLSSAGDVDGDDRADFLIGVVNYDSVQRESSGAAYLIAAADLEAADAADGAADRVVEAERVVSQPGSWKFISERGADKVGFSVALAGDISGDGLPEFLIGAPEENGSTSVRRRGAVYLVSPADLSAADAADGTTDGVVGLANIPAQANSWKFVGEGAEERAGISVGPLGDVNGDNVPDLVIGAPGYRWAEVPDPGQIYLVSGQGLKAADMADGDEDGIIDLAEIASQAGSWELTGEIAGDHVGTTAPSTYVDENGERRLIVHAPSLTSDSVRKTGAVYLIAFSELSAADSADGEADGIVGLAQAALRPGSWQLIGEDGNRAQHGASIGDHDGDGTVDVIVRVQRYAYFLSGADFVVADESDGIRDRSIVLTPDMEAPNSWSSLSPYRTANNGGIASGQIDGDAHDDLVMQNPKTSYYDTPTYLLSGAALAAYEGTGRVQPDEFLAGEGTWELLSFLNPITAVAMAGDVDSDGKEDVLLGSNSWIYLINSADLDALDSADDSRNEIIDLGQTTGDTDQDGVDDITDPDDDNDGFPDFEDRFPQDSSEWADFDRDGVGDNTDAFPNDWNGRFDTDGDGIADRQDSDDDGDGIADVDDDYPLDTDNDATDNAEDTDDDNDGVEDSEDAFPLNSAESGDFDADGTGDNADTDDDNDGVLDASDAFPNDARESVDTDSDGVGDNSDAFVNDADESIDTDGDGQGNNADTDDDNDGTADASDVFPLDAAETMDSDSDGIGDNGDTFPQDSTEWTDTDSDGKGNNADTDDDGDGYTDGADSYPLDADRQRLFMFRLSGQNKESLFGDVVISAGDVDSDGQADLLIGAPGAPRSGQHDGRAHVVTGPKLEAADRTDGMRDGVVSLGDIAAQSGHWALVGKRYDDRLGYDLLAAGDIGGDGKEDWLLGASGRNNTTAAAYLVSPSDLVDLYPGGSRDGATNIAEILSAAGSWELTAEGQGHDFSAGAKVTRIEDTDGDGKPEFLIGTPWHSEDHDLDAAAPGAAYLVSSAHLTSANAASTGDGSRIELSDLRGKSGAWKFLGEADGDRAGASVAAAGDIDGDGLGDLVIGAFGHTDSLNDQGAIYLIAAANLSAADRADGRTDRVIRLANVSRQSSSWKLLGEHENGLAGYSVARSDLNGDGKAELVITAAGVSGSPAAVYVLPLSELPAADAADGARNGVISLSHVTSLENGWKLEGEDRSYGSAVYVDFFIGHELIAAPRVVVGDVNGDGVQELMVGTPDHYYLGSGSTAYLISAADLASADSADGQLDGEILFANIAAQENSWKFVHDDFLTSVAAPGDLNGDGIVDVTMATIGNPWWDSYGSLHIVSSGELALADSQDGAADGVIYPGGLPDWYRSADFDLDGIEDPLDTDDDNDDVADSRDAFPNDASESLDSDHDGIGDNADPDDDNDGTEDSADAFPFNPYETIDSDGDGVGDNADTDDDNDGVLDEDDAFPLDFYESVDSDGDGIGDNIDPDDDNDGIPDDKDDTPRGGSGYFDGDGAGIASTPDSAPERDVFFYTIRGESLVIGDGDFDGDGLADIIVSSAAFPSAAYLISAADIGHADDADGASDRLVDFDRVSSLPNSWKFSGLAETRSMFFAGDVDSDGLDDVLVFGKQRTFLVPINSLYAADAADGRTDRTITLGENLLRSATGVWRLAEGPGELGVVSLADINADGHNELLIGSRKGSAPVDSNTAYVVSGSDWLLADGLDEHEDDIIDLDRVAQRSGSFKVIAKGNPVSGASISPAGDVDGDGYADLMITVPGNLPESLPGASALYLLSGLSMTSMDGRDGTIDGVIRLRQSQGTGLWHFTGDGIDAEQLHSAAGDVDGDGLADVLIAGQQGAFLIAGGDISAADAADGESDQAIELVNVLAQPGSYQFKAEESGGSGLRVIGVGDFDGDSLDDIAIVRSGSSKAQLIAAKDLSALDKTNGIVNVSRISSLPNSWVLDLTGADALFDGIASSGDLNGDGRPELVLGIYSSSNAASKSAYIVSTAQLAEADRLDGASDRSLALSMIAEHLTDN